MVKGINPSHLDGGDVGDFWELLGKPSHLDPVVRITIIYTPFLGHLEGDQRYSWDLGSPWVLTTYPSPGMILQAENAKLREGSGPGFEITNEQTKQPGWFLIIVGTKLKQQQEQQEQQEQQQQQQQEQEQ